MTRTLNADEGIEPKEREPFVSPDVPDWSREACQGFWDPGRRLLKAHRSYHYWHARRQNPVGWLMRRVRKLEYRFWTVVTGAEIQFRTQIGGGLLIPHPNGIVIHPDVKIGPNCLIFQQVTIGAGGSGRGVPTVGGHVDIGAGAKILGPITIGDHAKVGANSVVLCDVPPGATAVGIPAKIIQPRPDRMRNNVE